MVPNGGQRRPKQSPVKPKSLNLTVEGLPWHDANVNTAATRE